MEKTWRVVLKPLVLLVALCFLGGVMLATADEFFGGSKTRNLFGMSQDALAGEGPPSRKRASVRKVVAALADGGSASPAESVPGREPVFMPASKSAGALAIPHVSERLLGTPNADAGAASP